MIVCHFAFQLFGLHSIFKWTWANCSLIQRAETFKILLRNNCKSSECEPWRLGLPQQSIWGTMWTMNFLMFKLVLEKAEEPEIKLPTSIGSSQKQESSIKTSISALLTMPKPLTVWITINWKILQEMGILDHLTCLLRNLYAGQEAKVRTGHGTKDWFQIGKGVSQGYILSPCLFNFYAESSCKILGWMNHKL